MGPTIFNINNFFNTFKNEEFYQYAGDCQIILTFSKEKSFQTFVDRINEIIMKAKTWTGANYLCLNTNKTPVCQFSTAIMFFKTFHFLVMCYRHYHRNFYRYQHLRYCHRHCHRHYYHQRCHRNFIILVLLYVIQRF